MEKITNFTLPIAGQLILALLAVGAVIQDADLLLQHKEQRAISCEFYDENRCRANSSECTTTIEWCAADTGKVAHCYALWSHTPETYEDRVKMKGCFTNTNECNQTECVNHSEPRKGNIYFCCCTGSMCNGRFTIELTTPRPTTEAPAMNTVDDMDFYVWPICGALILLTGIVYGVVIYVLTARDKKNKTLQDEVDASNMSPLLCENQIELIEMKANGRFGDVWHGRISNKDVKDKDVAVKIFSAKDKESWVMENEVYKLPRIRHANILEFMGHQKQPDKPNYWIITIYHHNGSLCDYLKSHTITWVELCKIAESMAAGLAHLHEFMPGKDASEEKPPVAHRDFKSKNVLLKADLTACIADFGLAKIFYPSRPCGDAHGQVGTRRYMAPEVLEGSINFNLESFLRIDVYACALVLWEMVSRCDVLGEPGKYQMPFEAELGEHPTLEQVQESVIMNKIRPKILDAWRAHEGLNVFCTTMEECWDHDPEARLSSSCVMERFVQLNKYPMPLEYIKNHIVNVDDIKETTNCL